MSFPSSFHSGEDKKGTAALNLRREVSNMAWVLVLLVFCHFSGNSRIQMPRAFHSVWASPLWLGCLNCYIIIFAYPLSTVSISRFPLPACVDSDVLCLCISWIFCQTHLHSGFKVPGYHISWYQQKTESVPQFLLRYYSDSNKYQGPGVPSSFSGSKDASANAGILLISGLQPDDEADYYCATYHSNTGTNTVIQT
jgi:hypothetical protein